MFKNYNTIIFIIFIFFLKTSYSSDYKVPRAAYSVYAADLDLDGDKDIIIGHKTAWGDSNKTITTMANNGEGLFSLLDSSIIFCGYQENIFCVRMDEDFSPDIIAFSADFSLGTAKRDIRIFYNENGFFRNFKDFSLNTDETFSEISTGDLDGDSDIDIVVASNGGQFWGVLYNDGAGILSEPVYYHREYYPLDIVCGDLNGDNRDDVVVGGYNELCFSIESGFECSQLSSSETRIRITDIDNDGDNDIVGLQNWYLIGHTGITIHENTDVDTFITHEQFLFQPPLSWFEISYVNNDSLPDLVCTGYDGIYVLTNLGGYALSQPQFFPIENYDQTLNKSFCADLDNNGYDDVITVRYRYSEIPYNLNILFNDGNGNFDENPVSIEDPVIHPQEFNLKNFPNPFNSSTTIQFTLKKPQRIHLLVYDISGKLIDELITRQQFSAGRHSINWPGKNNNGKAVSSGLYVYTLKTQDRIISGKMLLVR